MTEALSDKLIIVGNASDDPFAIDLAYAIGQSTASRRALRPTLGRCWSLVTRTAHPKNA